MSSDPLSSDRSADADRRRAALERGAAAEALVASWLAGQGWRALARNWIGGGGELDIVVARGGKLRLVEVKLRAADDPVGLDAITPMKQRHLRRAAEAWLDQYDQTYDEVAFAVAYVEDDRITWIDDAF